MRRVKDATIALDTTREDSKHVGLPTLGGRPRPAVEDGGNEFD